MKDTCTVESAELKHIILCKDIKKEGNVKTYELTGKQELLLKQLKKFYSNKSNMAKLLNIVEQRSDQLSLRLIECFAVNYSNHYNTIYNIDEYKEKALKKTIKGKTMKKKKNTRLMYDSYFKVYNSYKSQLSEVSKNNFDAFCRGPRIKYHYDVDNYIITTIGQLNFFKWAIENYVLEYIEEHKVEIKKYMDKYNNKKTTGVSQKKKEGDNTEQETTPIKSINKSLSNIKQPNTQSSARKKRNIISRQGYKSMINYNLVNEVKFA